MISITLRDGIVFVEFPDGCEVDLAVQQVIYRQRRALFEENGRRKQKVVYLGQISDLNMSAAKYACSAQFAEITEALVMIANSNLNLTRANMMFGLHKPDFPVLVTPTMNAGLEWLARESWNGEDEIEGADAADEEALAVQDGTVGVRDRRPGPGAGVRLGRYPQFSGAQPPAR